MTKEVITSTIYELTYPTERGFVVENFFSFEAATNHINKLPQGTQRQIQLLILETVRRTSVVYGMGQEQAKAEGFVA